MQFRTKIFIGSVVAAIVSLVASELWLSRQVREERQSDGAPPAGERSALRRSGVRRRLVGLRSGLSPREPDALYAELLRRRRELPRELEMSFDEDARTLELRRGRATLRADFANETVELQA